MPNGFFQQAAAAAIALLSLNSLAHAQDNDACTIATLKGSYGVTVHGQSLGILTGTAPNQVLHRFAAPVDIDAVALATFDGTGTGTQEDFAMFNGAVRPGSPPDSFVSNEMLSYNVDANCTGELRLTFPNDTKITQKIVVVDNGNEISGVTSAQHIASGPPAFDTTPCDKGCDVAIQASAHFVRVGQKHEHEH
ncbi:conserved exported hypothetical protein [Paraburkholderia ribeironis]|uniref:Uncharacterized protein n=1 Tax=Paraburkholderia ribeironis TaxID=1247936 RepID=A0A1N7S760_9BURK|nr:hypothetical protein [Paraburkholderia ribeironis]SIT43225.1 conserved exported hypothetical protein [Paraburkholderia ribeironis]